MKVERDGRIEIHRTTQAEQLEATRDERRHYVLCAKGCGTLIEVPWRVISAICAACLQREELEP